MKLALFLCAVVAVAQPGFAATADDAVVAALGKRLFPAAASVAARARTVFRGLFCVPCAQRIIRTL